MKKRILFVVLTSILAAMVYYGSRPTANPQPWDVIDRVEAAMGDDWQKIREQRFFPFVFTSEDSGEIIYYVCQTLFFSDPPQVLEGMPEPLLEIVQPDAADSREARTVSGLPAVLYLRESRAYLCWTVSEEYSLCLSYDPSLVLENEILQMAESVPANLPGT